MVGGITPKSADQQAFNISLIQILRRTRQLETKEKAGSAWRERARALQNQPTSTGDLRNF
jgi:hypothetical protein